VSGDVEPLHQCRVATRRLRELLPLCTAGDTSAVAKKVRRHLGRIGRAMGEVRELDVALALVDEFADTRPVAVEHLRDHLRDARRAGRARMLKRLDGIKTAKVDRLLAEVSKGLAVAPKPEAFRQALAVRLVRRARRLREAVTAAGAMYVPDRVHAVRISLKKLRYALEFTRDSGLPRLATRVARLKQVQETLGRLNDLEALQRFVREAPLGGRPDSTWVAALETFRRALERQCRQLHSRYVRRRLAVLSTCAAARQTASRMVKPPVTRARTRALKMSLAARSGDRRQEAEGARAATIAAGAEP
jgi:CHAD domain-containing protein